MEFQLTEEQQAIVDAAQQQEDNLILYARAGAAKTTTLIELSKVIENDTLCLAFNKKIADEMTARMPQHVKAKTMNGLGHGALGRYLRKRMFLQKDKVYQIAIDMMETQYSKSEQEELREDFGDLLRMVRAGKSAGWLPEHLEGPWRPLIRSNEDFFLTLPIEPSGLQVDFILKASEINWKHLLKGTIDFDDQVLGAGLLSVPFDFPKTVLVDEAQDLSPLNHRILSKVSRRARVIAVGDPYQAIYGFRGADTRSMETLEELFNMKPMYLTTSFRCGYRIIEEARSRAPDICAAPWAEAGEVRSLEKWSAADLPESAAIICRNNAPLFSMAIKLLKENRRVELVGRDVVQNLIKLLEKLGRRNLSRDGALQKLQEWYVKEKKRARETGVVEDKHACAKLFIERSETLGGAIQLADAINNQQGSIKLMTGHKSKGLEFDTVFFLDPQLINPKNEQDRNLKYVIQTRARKQLNYATTELFQGEDDE